MRVLTVITARGGSKSIPKKNIVDLCGKPLIVHTIESALKLGSRLNQVIVSTDNEEIAAVSRAAGADVPFLRPKDLSADETASLPVLVHATKFIEERDRLRFDWVLLLQPTSPLRSEVDIGAALDLASEGDATAVISVCNAMSHHPYKMFGIENGYLEPFSENWVEGIRRQDLNPVVYKTNGAIYLAKRDVLMEQNSLFGQRPRAFVMPEERSIDIDSPHDLIVASSLIGADIE